MLVFTYIVLLCHYTPLLCGQCFSLSWKSSLEHEQYRCVVPQCRSVTSMLFCDIFSRLYHNMCV